METQVRTCSPQRMNDEQLHGRKDYLAKEREKLEVWALNALLNAGGPSGVGFFNGGVLCWLGGIVGGACQARGEGD